MPKDIESDVKTVRPGNPEEQDPARDPTMTGGERAETRQERKQRENRKREPKEPPIIQKDVT